MLSHIKDYVPGVDGMVVHGAGEPWHSEQLATNAALTSHTGAASPHSGHEVTSNKDTSTSLGTSDTKYPSQKAVKEYVDTAVGGVSGGSGDARLINDGRIERASDTSLTWTGYALGLYDVAAAAWIARIPSSAPSLANTALDLDGNALTYDAQYDIYAEGTDGSTTAVALKAKKFTSGNTRAVTPALWQGRYCYDNTTDAGKRRLWLATIRLRNDGGTAKFTDEQAKRWVSNRYNPKQLYAYYYAYADGASFNNTVAALWTNWTSPGVSIVLCEAQSVFYGGITAIMNNSGRGNRQIFVDGSLNGSILWNDSSGNGDASSPYVSSVSLAAGYHYFDLYRAVGSSSALHWWGEIGFNVWM